MSVLYFLRHTTTGKRFQIVSRDKETGTVKLKGSLGEFTETFNPETFKKQGYVLEKEEADAESTGI